MTRGLPGAAELGHRVQSGDRLALARLLSLVERDDRDAVETAFGLPVGEEVHVIGFTGAPGSGKSTLIDAVTACIRARGSPVGVLAVDPSSPYSGGALLGDRLRMMRHVGDVGVFIRSLANRGHLGGLSAALPSAVRAVAACGFTTVLIETVGVGQAEVEIGQHADTTVVVSTPGTGDAVQASKAGVLEIADVLVVNKADREGVREAARDLRDMLRLTPTAVGGWRVPVLVTRADTGDGVEELVGVLGEHLDHAARSGTLSQARTDRLLAAVRSYATVRLLQRLDAELGSRAGRCLLAQVASGGLSPVEAAKQLLADLDVSAPLTGAGGRPADDSAARESGQSADAPASTGSWAPET